MVLQLHIQPRASREGFAGVTEQGVRIRLMVPPTEGRANQSLQAFLAREFGVPKGEVSLEQGAAGRHKRVRIHAPRLLPKELPLKKP